MSRTYDHPGSVMHGWPVHRRETYLIEAICPHGVGHPIPESIEHMDAYGHGGAVGTWGIHGCDGCCSRANEVSGSNEVSE